MRRSSTALVGGTTGDDLFRHLDLGAYRSTVEGELLDANRAFFELFGLPEDTDPASIRTPELYLHPEDRERLVAALRARGTVREMEVPLRRGDGAVWWGALTATLLSGSGDNGGRIEGVVGEVTERRRRESEREAIGAIARLFLEEGASERLFDMVAHALTRTLRFPLAGVSLSEPESDAVHFVGVAGLDGEMPRRGRASRLVVGEAVRTGRAVVVEDLERHAPDNEARELLGVRSVVAVPLRWHGEILGALSMADVRVRSDAREIVPTLEVVGTFLAQTMKRRESERALRRSERRAATLMANVPGMVYRCRNDPSWAMDFVSDGARDLTGYGSGELVSGAVPYASLIVVDDRARVWREVQQAIEEERPFRIEYRIRTAGGEERTVWEQGRWVPDGETGPAGHLEGLILDITERQRAVAELRELTVTLEERVERRVAELQAVYELTRELAVAAAPEELVEVLLERLCRTVGLDVVALARPEDGRGYRVSVRRAVRLGAAAEQELRFRVGDAVARLADTGEAVAGWRWVADPSGDEVMERLPTTIEIPLLGSGTVEGVLVAGRVGPPLSADELRLIYTMAGLAAGPLERSTRLEQRP